MISGESARRVPAMTSLRGSTTRQCTPCCSNSRLRGPSWRLITMTSWPRPAKPRAQRQAAFSVPPNPSVFRKVRTRMVQASFTPDMKRHGCPGSAMVLEKVYRVTSRAQEFENLLLRGPLIPQVCRVDLEPEVGALPSQALLGSAEHRQFEAIYIDL